MRYQDKVVVVTGGANGIGKAIAKAYQEEGATVIVADIVKPSEESVHFYKTDVSNPSDINRLFAYIKEQYDQLDILINNAGISSFGDFYDISLEEWDRVLNTNLRSVFLCSQQAARIMRQQANGGSLVHIASTRAFMSEANTESYAASKGGIFALTHALAMTLQEDHITSNAISPGWIQNTNYEKLREIDHEQHPSKRVGKPEDVARACLFLTDPANNFINGENFVIDGGMTRKMIYEH
ncbi:oxidoreductase [Gracilibacillus boraciitolerans JCM 21714]|uniref:Oxidoreductase n=1 Tax=Gracilibacillus boraciitolerans JCM 21714 TaxID=1298598 RepID=W4VPF0_9BACI|nr:SDR family oxidoreductase [Gracilibacillus boraciitolerans]GAE94624.1 oxidoreductase [Gracilibacillus boraciitolerans JCM 21714]